MPKEDLSARAAAQTAARAPLPPAKQILFGDLHVHTTFSADAFIRSLPMLQGEGAHPPADACDFARFCSALDFWSINDHAEAISPQHWQETKESIRQCNAVAGDPQNPDLVAFLGWEWTQVGATPETHYGHKNVIFRDTADDQVPARPISALERTADRRAAPARRRSGSGSASRCSTGRTASATSTSASSRTSCATTPLCPHGVDTRQLPADCQRGARTRRRSCSRSSAQWGFDTIVIPHGNDVGLLHAAGHDAGTSSSPPRSTIPSARR